tara:strand:- start:62 stop:946 length:885 start_codon:yes stop_codon:yes gene_type:complete
MVANYSSSPLISGSQLGNLDGLLLAQESNNTDKKKEKKKLNPLQWLREKILGAQGMTIADDGQVVGLNTDTKGIVNTDRLFNSTSLGLNSAGSDLSQLYNAAPGTFANPLFTTDTNLLSTSPGYSLDTGEDLAKYFTQNMPYSPTLENLFITPEGKSAGITGFVTKNNAIANLDPKDKKNGDGNGNGDGNEDGNGKGDGNDKPTFNLPDMLGMPVDEYMELSAKMANQMANQAAFRASLKDATDALYEGGRAVGEIGSAIGTQSAAATQALKPADLLTQFKYVPYSSSLGRLIG